MTEEGTERFIAGLRVHIDATLCVGFGDCVELAPGAFRLDSEDVVEFVVPTEVERDRLLSACEACPVDALTVWSDDGAQLVP